MKNFFKRSKGWLIFLLVVIVAVGGWAYSRRNNNTTASTFQTEAIARGDLTASIGATGTVRAKQTAILVWQAAGKVDTVNVKIGDNVPVGFVMAYLSKSSLPQSIIMAEADLATAQQDLDKLLNSDTARAQAVIDLRNAQDAYDKAYNWRRELDQSRIKVKKIVYKKFRNRTFPVIKEYKMWADDATKQKAQEDLDLAKAKLDDAQRTYDQLINSNSPDIQAAQARVNAAQASINMGRITAPFGGIVTESDPLQGDQVSAGATAFRIDDLSTLYVDVQVSEVDINSIAVGQDVSLSFDAILGNKYAGQVVEVGKVGNTVGGVVNFTVTVELDNRDGKVKPGMTAAVNIITNQVKDVVLIPNRAVRLSNGDRVVYLMKTGVPTKTTVTLGLSSDTMSVLAGGDVKEGDTIVLNPPTDLFQSGGGPRGGFGGGG